MSSNSENFWDMYPIRVRIRSGCRTASLSSTVIVPSVGAIDPVSIRIVVVLPDPFGPRNPNTSPQATSNVMPSTAANVPYLLVTSRMRTTGLAADSPLIPTASVVLRGSPRRR